MLKKLTSEKGGSKDSSEEGNSCLINREELDWALDCVQTRNCRVDLNDIISSTKIAREERLKGDDKTMKTEVNVIEDDNNEDDDLDNNSDNRLSVLSPFFDLMNHDKNVQTVFEVRQRSTPPSFSSSSSPPPSLLAVSDTFNFDVCSEPVLTVRYEGHGVKKGDQVSLNYRR